MANNVQLRNALQGLGFTQAGATYIIDDQGFGAPEDLALLTDDEAVNVCKVTRRPGGTLANGNANPGNPVSIMA